MTKDMQIKTLRRQERRAHVKNPIKKKLTIISIPHSGGDENEQRKIAAVIITGN